MLIVPSLVYVLSVSIGVHVINYYLGALAHVPPHEAPQEAMRQAVLPCSLSTVTTAIGLISLMVSYLVPVDKFALYSALGLVLSTLTLFIVLPAQLAEISARRLVAAPATNNENVSHWSALLRVVTLLRFPILAVTIVLFVVSICGVVRLRSSARIYDLFRDDARIIEDYNWFERTIGPLVPLEIVLRFPRQREEEAPSIADKLRYVTMAHSIAHSQQDVGAVVSAASFSPPLPRRARGADVAREAALNHALEEHRHRFVELALLRDTPEEELWRISSRSYASHDVDYAAVLAQLHASLEPLLEKYSEQTGVQASVVVCGGVPLVQVTQRQMIRDLKKGSSLLQY